MNANDIEQNAIEEILTNRFCIVRESTTPKDDVKPENKSAKISFMSAPETVFTVPIRTVAKIGMMLVLLCAMSASAKGSYHGHYKHKPIAHGARTTYNYPYKKGK